tara:strand:- start:1593 stop:3710 length:2118 start_codon:yes stop_codon:yes gene_type:complete
MGLFDAFTDIATIGDRNEYIADRNALDLAKLNRSIIDQNDLNERKDRAEARQEKRDLLSDNTATGVNIKEEYGVWTKALLNKTLNLVDMEGTGGEEKVDETEEERATRVGFAGTFQEFHESQKEVYKNNPDALRHVELQGAGIQAAYDITHASEKSIEDLIDVSQKLEKQMNGTTAYNPSAVKSIMENIQTLTDRTLRDGISSIPEALDKLYAEGERYTQINERLQRYTKHNPDAEGNSTNLLLAPESGSPDQQPTSEELKANESLRKSVEFRDANPKKYQILKEAQHNMLIGDEAQAETELNKISQATSTDIGLKGQQGLAEAKSQAAVIKELRAQTRLEVVANASSLKTSVSNSKGKDNVLYEYFEELSEMSAGVQGMIANSNYDDDIFSEMVEDSFRSVVNKIVKREEGGMFGGGEVLSLGVEVFEEFGAYKDEVSKDLEMSALLMTGKIFPRKVPTKGRRDGIEFRWNVINTEESEANLIYKKLDENNKFVTVNGYQDLAFKVDNASAEKWRNELQYADSGLMRDGDNLPLKNAMRNAAELYLKSRKGYADRKAITPAGSKLDKRAVGELTKISLDDDIRKQIGTAMKDQKFDIYEQRDLIDSFESADKDDVKKVLDLLASEKLLSEKDVGNVASIWEEWNKKSTKEKKAWHRENKVKKGTTSSTKMSEKEQRDFRRSHPNLTKKERITLKETGLIPERFR